MPQFQQVIPFLRRRTHLEHGIAQRSRERGQKDQYYLDREHFNQPGLGGAGDQRCADDWKWTTTMPARIRAVPSETLPADLLHPERARRPA